MPALTRLRTIDQDRGSLTVLEKGVPFVIRRVFYTYNVPAGTIRGGHGHRRCRMALVAAAGVCVVSGFSADGSAWSYRLEDPAECLVLEPGDWHRMAFESEGTVLISFASEEYDAEDYFYDPPSLHT